MSGQKIKTSMQTSSESIPIKSLSWFNVVVSVAGGEPTLIQHWSICRVYWVFNCMPADIIYPNLSHIRLTQCWFNGVFFIFCKLFYKKRKPIKSIKAAMSDSSGKKSYVNIGYNTGQVEGKEASRDHHIDGQRRSITKTAARHSSFFYKHRPRWKCA